MKRIVSLVLALSMVLGLCATAFAGTSLTDVVGTKYEAAVEALIELEVVNGYPNGKYQPTKEVNRAELAKMLVVCMGLEEDAERAKGDTIFTDEALKDGGTFSWARGYVNTAATAGVIKGYPAGDFKPEKTVTYAEALTMMLRALGYGNVMEAEGTWPTNAILKARELELTDDVKYNSSSDGATRGDIAILLWNMLRTPMWKISAENQGTGMTSEMGSIMLNVKFPDYVYGEGTLVSYEINDGKVTVVVNDEDLEDSRDFKKGNVEGTVTDIDLLRLVDGMEVSYLYNIEDEEFLTLTTLENLIEGRVKLTKKNKLEVNGKEYKNLDELASADEYVVFYADGKKIEKLVKLTEKGAYEVGADNGKTLKKAKKEVGEDAIVVIDGVWSTNEDLKEGDVVTKVTPATGDAFYVVARTTVKGEFESFTEDENSEETRYYLEVDGKEYEADDKTFTVYEYDEDDEEYDDVTTEAKKEFADKKGKYFGEDVELVLDYLGNVINLYYGEVKDTEEDDYNFYVMTGKYGWDESSRDGKVYYYEAADVNGEDTYKFTRELYNELLKALEDANKNVYEQFNSKLSDDDELAKALVDSLVFAATLNDDEELELDEAELAKYFKAYTIEAEEGKEILDEDDENYFDGKAHKVTSSTKVFTIKAIIDEDKNGNDEVVGIEVEVSEGKDALEGVKYAKYYVAQEEDAENPGQYVDKTAAASYVFVGENAKSTDLNFGLVERFTKRAGVQYITISGTKYELDKDGKTPEVGELVSFRIDEDAAKVMDRLATTDLDDDAAVTVTKVEDGTVYLSRKVTEFNDVDKFDLDRKTTKDLFEDYTFVLGTANFDEDDNIEFDADTEVLGEGIENVSFKKGDRIVLGDNEVIAVIRGIKVDEKVENGALVD